MKYARAIFVGVVADKPTEYKKENLFLQRVVDKGGDSICITLAGDKIQKTAYLVPTEYLKQFLEEPLEDESEEE